MENTGYSLIMTSQGIVNLDTVLREAAKSWPGKMLALVTALNYGDETARTHFVDNYYKVLWRESK